MRDFTLLVRKGGIIDVYDPQCEFLGPLWENIHRGWYGEKVASVVSIDAYVDQVTKGLIRNTPYVFYHDGNDVSMLLGGYKMIISDIHMM